MLTLSHPNSVINGNITISGSKSESNRGLILQKLFPQIKLENLSTSDDTVYLKNGLNSLENNITQIDIHHAGTAMRFLTAFLSLCQEKTIILKGSDRMHQRPIYPLVNALRKQGAKIEYLENDNYPPLKIYGQKLEPNSFEVPGNISSQYITALMLVASSFSEMCEIKLTTELTSRPYLEMTASFLEKVGSEVKFKENCITINPANPQKGTLKIESDWSSASYWFSMVAIANDAEIKLSHFYSDSRQGDKAIKDIYKDYFGVITETNDNFLKLKKNINYKKPNSINLDLNATPDIAQTIAVTCSALKIKAKLTGLHTLKIKETDRLFALKQELNKIGTETKITSNSIEILSFSDEFNTPIFDTYNDHRMALSFAPLALLFPINIKEPSVVTKSYPSFYLDLEKVGFNISS